MQATRWEILEILKGTGEATVDELARQLGLAPITVRYHLAILESKGLVTTERVRGQVGRPYLVYSLTEAAEELFPKKYHLLADRLLAEVKTLIGKNQIEAIFARMAEDISAEYVPRLSGKSIEERLTALVDLLGEEGFLARWERSGDKYVLVETSCPYRYVGQRHPEVCNLDLRLITDVLDTSVTRSTCVVHGDEVCTFHITPEESSS
jgi:predicted ArsR family transcriptional regulator